MLGEIAAFDYAIKNEALSATPILFNALQAPLKKKKVLIYKLKISQQTSPKTDNEAEKITSPTSPKQIFLKKKHSTDTRYCRNETTQQSKNQNLSLDRRNLALSTQ